MDHTKNTEAVLIRYLLGKMSEDEKRQVEARYFTDDLFFEQLLAVEDVLIEGYARGEFPEGERDQAKDYFLRSPARRRRVEIAGALTKYLAALRAQSPRNRESVNRLWWRILISFLRSGKQ